MISVDITFIYQVIAFLIMLVILKQVLFKPILAVLEERKEKTENTFEGAASIEAEIEQGNEGFKKRISDAESKAQDERIAIRQAALEDQKVVVEDARTQLQSDIAKVKDEVAGNRDKVLEELMQEAPKISRVIAEKMLERALPILLIVFTTVLLPTLVFASSGGGSPFNTDLLWKGINFIVLVVAIVIVWKKFLKKALEGRADDIRAQLAEAEIKRKEAEAKLAEYKQKESGFAAIIAEAEARIKKDAELEKEKIRAEAAAMVEKLKEQARYTAEQEVERARVALKKEAALLAMEMAKTIIAKEIRGDDQDRLVKTYIDKLRLN
ncbi:hypothetical protein MNBD_DELTA01-810 [hydrothermal vent metagenome]|uniref:ATP synthase F0 sector subunit b n=1 Tax=hydrothermal vent metagenome TaxID=652676 RepID=A0A3B0QV77_9ZZZZ